MSTAGINNFFTIVAILVGAVSIIINLTNFFETLKGTNYTEEKVIKKYVNTPFAFSLVMLSILWVTSFSGGSLIVNGFIGLTIGWFIAILISIVVPSVANADKANKKNARANIIPCVFKVIWLAGILWLIL